MKPRTRPWAPVGPLAVFAALTIAWTWPLVRHLTSAIPGDPGDNYSFLWNLWWMRRVLTTPGLEFFHTTYLFFPFGTNIANHPHTALPALVAATLLKGVSVVTAQNLLLLAVVVTTVSLMLIVAVIGMWPLIGQAAQLVMRREYVTPVYEWRR